MPQVELVCFTGDVTDFGLKEEYSQATPLVNSILEAVGAERSRFFVVPSNHDVQQDEEVAAWEETRKLLNAYLCRAQGIS